MAGEKAGGNGSDLVSLAHPRVIVTDFRKRAAVGGVAKQAGRTVLLSRNYRKLTRGEPGHRDSILIFLKRMTPAGIVLRQ